MALRSAAISLLVLLFFAPAIVDAERLPARVFTTADGLANNEIHRIVRDLPDDGGGPARDGDRDR